MRARAPAPALFAALCALFSFSLSAACGGPPPAANAGRSVDAGASAADGAASPGTATDAYASLEILSARGPSDAPLMRELLRVERAVPRSPDLRAERDLCLRAVFAAPKVVRAFFADPAGAPRGEIATGASGTVPPRGPVCAIKGEVLHLVVESSDGLSGARAVIFAAP